MLPGRESIVLAINWHFVMSVSSCSWPSNIHAPPPHMQLPTLYCHSNNQARTLLLPLSRLWSRLRDASYCADETGISELVSTSVSARLETSKYSVSKSKSYWMVQIYKYKWKQLYKYKVSEINHVGWCSQPSPGLR